MRTYIEPKTLPEMAIFVKLMFDDTNRQLQGLSHEMHGLSTKIDGLDLVSSSQHSEDMASLRAEIFRLEQNVEGYRVRQASLWKWLIGSLIIPTVAVIVAAV